MDSAGACLSIDTVVSYAAGQLTARRLNALDAHLDACNACNQLIIEALNDRGTALARPRCRPRIFCPAQVIAGRYEILTFLGAGGMGEVYEARDLELGEVIALKTVSAELPLDRAAVGRLKAEAQLARRVTHRNVCRIFDVGVHTDRTARREGAFTTPFLTMELIRGRSLSDRIRSGERFEARQAVEIARQITCGLEAAHEAGVLHRDLKSDNVLLSTSSDEKLRAVITDFGLAAAIAAADEGGGAPSGSSLGGTLPYLAPERLTGSRATVASDIYSLGMVLREVTTGALSLASSPSDREELPSSLPLASLIRRCLHQDPKRRFTTVSEVLHAVELHAPSPIEAAVLPADSAAPWRRGKLRDRVRLRAVWALPGIVTLALALLIPLLIREAGSRSDVPTPDTVTVAPATPSPVVAARRLTSANAVPDRPPTKSRARRSVARRVGVTASTSARQLLVASDQHLRAGRTYEACAAAQNAAALAPESADVWESLGRCYMRLGEPARARVYYRRCLAIAPDGPDAMFIRAIVDEEQP